MNSQDWMEGKVGTSPPQEAQQCNGPLRAISGFLEARNPSCPWHSHSPRPLSRSQSSSFLRNIHPTEACTLSCDPLSKGSSPFIRRQASLPHILDWMGSGFNSRAPAPQGWSRSEQDLRSPLLESIQQQAELVGHLQTDHGTLKEQAQDIQRREKALELSQMKCELLDLRQKMESSLVRLEWERRELERSRIQEQQQDRELHNRILHLQAEVMKVKLCLDRMSQQPLVVEDSEKEPSIRFESQGAALNTKLQTLLTTQNSILQEKPGLDNEGQGLSSDANETPESLGKVPLQGPRTSTPQESQGMILLQEELTIVKEVNEQLSSELGQSRQRLRTCLHQLYQLQAEKKISHSCLQALETERAQLVGENLVLLSVLQGRGAGVELRPDSWQNGEASGDRWFQKELAAPQQEPEEEAPRPRTHQEVVQYWKARWRQVADELKSKEEELEMVQRQRTGWSCKIPWVQELLTGEEEDLAELKAPLDRAKETSELEGAQLVKMHQALSGEDSSSLTEKVEHQRDLQNKMKILEQEHAEMALVIQRWKMDKGPMLQTELDACKQELELERNLCLTLKHQLQGGGAPQGAEPLQTGPCRPGTLKGTEAEPQWDTQGQPKAEPQRLPQELQGSSLGSPQVPQLPRPVQRDTRGVRETGDPGPLSEAEILKQQLQKERTLGQEREQLLRSLTAELQELKLRKSEEHKACLPTTQDSGQQGLETTESQVLTPLAVTPHAPEFTKSFSRWTTSPEELREIRKENLRLQLLVSSLEEKLEEKEQALRELLTPRASEQGETEMMPSSLLKKLPLNSRWASCHSAPEEQKKGPRAEGVPQGHCTHCNAFLEQLDRVLQGWAASSKPAEEKSQAEGQLQKVLEGPNKHAPRGRAPRNDLRDVERVKQQHRLVTAQLQDLFGERRERTARTGQPPREWPEGSSGDQGAKKPPVEQLN